MICAVITENDKSQWHDETGVAYHFPARYAKFLTQGTLLVYYKGKLKDKEFERSRLSNQARERAALDPKR